MNRTQTIENKIANKGKTLDLGCGTRKLKNAFGVDINKTANPDMVWDLNKELPQNHFNKYDLVFSACLLDHLGNPQKFLEECKHYAKPNGFIQVIVDNGDYWRYHNKLHWFNEYHSANPQHFHKMFFQLGHLEHLFESVGLKISKKEYFWKPKLTAWLPKHLSNAYINIVGIKA